MFCAYVAQVAWLSPQIPQIRLVMKCASRGSLPFMKMLYPRKMDEVLWHSATCRFSKSIFVKIPKLPTIRVIGSQFMSTSFLEPVGVLFDGIVVVPIFSLLFRLVRPGSIASSQLRTWMTPLRFFVYRSVCKCPQRSNRLAIHSVCCSRNLCSRGFVNERHDFVREAWHGAANADAADVRAPANACHPPALRHVAVDHWPPAT